MKKLIYGDIFSCATSGDIARAQNGRWHAKAVQGALPTTRGESTLYRGLGARRQGCRSGEAQGQRLQHQAGCGTGGCVAMTITTLDTVYTLFYMEHCLSWPPGTASAQASKDDFKCPKQKPESEFYSRPRMADGLLGKCKECTGADVPARHGIKRQDLIWLPGGVRSGLAAAVQASQPDASPAPSPSVAQKQPRQGASASAQRGVEGVEAGSAHQAPLLFSFQQPGKLQMPLQHERAGGTGHGRRIKSFRTPFA